MEDEVVQYRVKWRAFVLANEGQSKKPSNFEQQLDAHSVAT
jgi:hypothetical protein